MWKNTGHGHTLPSASAIEPQRYSMPPHSAHNAFGDTKVFVLAISHVDTANMQGYKPAVIIAVPVGFVNVVESKEMIMQADAPCIAARDRKGGNNIAAAICNAVLREI